MKKSELKKLIREEIGKNSPLNRKYGESLPTLKDMTTYKSNKSKLKEEAKTDVTVTFQDDTGGKGTYTFSTFETKPADIKKTAQNLFKSFKILKVDSKPIK